MTGPQKQFELLVRDYADDLQRYALWLCRNPTLAADLVQETFLRAWKAHDRLRDRQAAKSWLITILRREYARTFERKSFDLTDIDELAVRDDGLDPQDETDLTLLRRAIAELDPKYREPIVLQVLGGFSCDEIAEILGSTRSAVMTQLFRARQQLKGVLVEDS